MNIDDKQNARAAGLLILLATATFITGSAMLEGVFSASQVITAGSANRLQVIGGALLEYVDAIAVAGVAVFLFPILTRYSPIHAISYLITRAVEGTLLLVGGMGALALIPMSEFVTEGATTEALGRLLVIQHDMAFQAAMLVLGVGSIPFCLLLFRYRLVPQWMALSGLVGYVALVASVIVAVAGYEAASTYLYIPGALFEVVFPLWLIFNGISTSEQTPASGIANPQPSET